MGRYMGMWDMRHVTAQIQNGQNDRCKAAEFHPVDT